MGGGAGGAGGSGRRSRRSGRRKFVLGGFHHLPVKPPRISSPRRENELADAQRGTAKSCASRAPRHGRVLSAGACRGTGGVGRRQVSCTRACARQPTPSNSCPRGVHLGLRGVASRDRNGMALMDKAVQSFIPILVCTGTGPFKLLLMQRPHQIQYYTAK